jgi:PAS domain-containing protein
MSSISTPAFLVDHEGTLVYFNEAAGGLVGRRFEETGPRRPEEWAPEFGPVDPQGQAIPIDTLPLTEALRHNRPVHTRMTIHSADGRLHEIELSALPIIGTDGFTGAMAIFWPIEDERRNGAAS